MEPSIKTKASIHVAKPTEVILVSLHLRPEAPGRHSLSLFSDELTLGKDTLKIQLPDALLGLIRRIQKYLQIGRKDGLGGKGS